MKASEFIYEAKQRLDAKCWKGKHKEGTKMKGGIRVNNCVPNESVAEDWNKVNKQDKTDGLSQKAVNAYRRENPGSKLKTAVTTKPSKLKAGSKDAKRRKSFCARMSGNKGPMKDEKGRPTPKAKALSRWNCESVEHMVDLIIENMDHSKDNQAVPELKAALLAKKTVLQNASEDDVYDIIDKIMTRIAKSHGISGQKLHDMWVDKYDQIPDTWVMKENFADGKHPEDKGDSARYGIPKHASISSLRKIAKQGGRKGQLAHWQANMRSGKSK